MSAVLAAGTSPERARRRPRHTEGERPQEMKVEPADLDIKDYAETTMNELLGWYGYEKLESSTRGGLHLMPFPSSSSSSSPLRPATPPSDESPPSSPLPHSPDAESPATSTVGGTIICGWCLKTGIKLFTLKTSSGKTKAFCSEPCFNQCRRAAFKKNRVCNWCRHVRHTVNYVDFKDGDDQLQFCSDKCLNQYKMQIFCKETQAYLQMNPHLKEEAGKAPGALNSKLITPDLWLRDCHEPVNGTSSLPRSDDEVVSPKVDTAKTAAGAEEIEDLTLSSKPEYCKLSGNSVSTEELAHEILASPESSMSLVDKPSFERYNSVTTYAREDRDKERKKRHHDPDKEHRRKRHMSSFRHRTNHHSEAPPAHVQSPRPPLSYPNQNRLMQSSGSPYHPAVPRSTSLNPPAAHSKSLPPHPAMAGPLLPPPPPLLNDFHHFNSPFLPHSMSPQQHLEAVLRIQSSLKHGETFPLHAFQDPMLPLVRGPQPQNSPASFVQPNTVMLPYPIFVPLPVPIPIPIPLASFLNNKLNKCSSSDIRKLPEKQSVPEDLSETLHVDSDSDDNFDVSDTKKSNSLTPEESNNMTHAENLTTEKVHMQSNKSSYAVTNDSQTNRLIITRNKTVK